MAVLVWRANPLAFPGRGAASFMPLRRAGTVTNTVLVTAPALQRTAKALRRVRGTEERHPRPTNGILLAITVMNSTLASSGRLAM
jgi:hypothetical protein